MVFPVAAPRGRTSVRIFGANRIGEIVLRKGRENACGKAPGSLPEGKSTSLEMQHAPGDALLPHFQPWLGLAADAFDLDRAGTVEAHAVEDFPDPDEVRRCRRRPARGSTSPRSLPGCP